MAGDDVWCKKQEKVLGRKTKIKRITKNNNILRLFYTFFVYFTQIRSLNVVKNIKDHFLHLDTMVSKCNGIIRANHAFPWLAVGVRVVGKMFVPDKRLPKPCDAGALWQLVKAGIEGAYPRVRKTVAVEAKPMVRRTRSVGRVDSRTSIFLLQLAVFIFHVPTGFCYLTRTRTTMHPSNAPIPGQIRRFSATAGQAMDCLSCRTACRMPAQPIPGKHASPAALG